MNHAELVPLVRETVVESALAFELHKGKQDHWRRVFKQAIVALPVKAGKQYKFLVVMAEQTPKAMNRVVGVLCKERI